MTTHPEQWEEFTVPPSDPKTRLHVTLNRKNELMIGARAFRLLNRPDAVVLKFDKLNSRIGLMPTHPKTKHAYPLKAKGTKYSHRILSASAFCSHHGINTDRTIAFHEVSINEKGMLVLDLKTTMPIGKIGRRP
jgi:hypothetical protein